MPDPRFFEDLGPVTLADLAAVTGARLGDPAAGERLVRAVSVMAGAGADKRAYVRALLKDIERVAAEALLKEVRP